MPTTSSGGELVAEWHDGRSVTPDDVAWALAVTSSLGCGWTVRIPYGAVDPAEPLAAARAAAQEVATLLGAPLDEAPWQALADAPEAVGPVEVTGVWEPRFRGPLGSARTRVTTRPEASGPDITASAVLLPWTYGSATALAGLPVPAPHEEAIAAAHLHEQGVEVGLWCDHRSLVCTSTAGPLLLLLPDGTWHHPAPSTGAVGHWLHARLAEAVGSLPAELSLDDLGTPGTRAWALDAWGSVTMLALRRPSVGPGAAPVGRRGEPRTDRPEARLRELRDALLPGRRQPRAQVTDDP